MNIKGKAPKQTKNNKEKLCKLIEIYNKIDILLKIIIFY